MRKPSGPWNCSNGYHWAIKWVDRVPTETYLDKDGTRLRREVAQFDRSDPRWPAVCMHCQYRFTNEDTKQTFTEEIYRRTDTGDEHILHQNAAHPELTPAPPGAMWHAYWMPSYWRGDDGISLVVRLANGHDWMVDSRASNCDQPDRPHKCWVRHGDPRTEPVSVDKDGDTCGAGAGSILAKDYHGFLSGGVLSAG